MPLSHTVMSELGLVVTTARDRVTLNDCREAAYRVVVDPLFQADFAVFVDLREMDFSPTDEEISKLATLGSSIAGNFRNRIAVVNPSSVHHGIAEIVASHGAKYGLTLRSFLEPQAAWRWLGFEHCPLGA